MKSEVSKANIRERSVEMISSSSKQLNQLASGKLFNIQTIKNFNILFLRGCLTLKIDQ